MRVPALPTFFCRPISQRLPAELIRVLARYPQAQAEVAAVFRQAGLRAATEIGGSAEKMIEGLPVVRSRGSPRPWLRAADNHGYRRFGGAGPTTSLVVGRGGSDRRPLAVPARPERAGAAAQMVSPATGRRSQGKPGRRTCRTSGGRLSPAYMDAGMTRRSRAFRASALPAVFWLQ